MKLKSILVSLGLAIFVLGVGLAAQAQEASKTVEGTVASVNEKDKTITLKDIKGQMGEMQFKASHESQIKDLKPGQQVNVTYEEKDNQNWIRELKTTSGEEPQKAPEAQPEQQPEQQQPQQGEGY